MSRIDYLVGTRPGLLLCSAAKEFVAKGIRWEQEALQADDLNDRLNDR